MHEPVIVPCIFGCQGCEDSLDHYLCCEPLWTAVKSVSFKRTVLLQSDPLTRTGLDGSSEWLQMIAIAFSCYHALKMGHRDEILSSLAFGHPWQVWDRLISYAKVYAVEICV